MIDPNNLDDIMAALHRHPEYIAGVIFTMEDVFAEADYMDIDRANIKPEAFDLRGWEGMATEDGFGAIQDNLSWSCNND